MQQQQQSQTVSTSNNPIMHSLNYPTLQDLYMEKKSKILGQRLIRKIIVEEGVITDKENRDKKYNDPVQIVRQEYHQHEKTWYEGCKSQKLRVLVKFENRGPIFVYLNDKDVERDFKEALLLKGGGLTFHRKSKPSQNLKGDVENIQKQQQ